MKNHDEFRRSVFEKAKRYEEKKRKQRNMLVRTASLCSLCIVIGLSAYFAAENGFFLTQDAVDTTIGMTNEHSDTNFAPTDITASRNPEEAETPNIENPIESTASTVVTSTTTPQFTFSTPVQSEASENTEFPVDTKTETPPTIETTTTLAMTVTSTTANTGVSPETIVCTASPLTLLTNRSAEAAARDVYTNAEDFQLALFSLYAKRITEKEREMLNGQFDASFFEKHDLAVVYVEDRWDGYTFVVSDGMAPYFSQIDAGDPNQPATMALHFYSISKEYAEETILVSYTKD